MSSLKKNVLISFVLAAMGSGVLFASRVDTTTDQDKASSRSDAGIKTTYFNAHVVPALAENGCPMCHAVGYIEPSFSYPDYRRLLAMGRAADDNYLINKITSTGRGGEPVHFGGIRCTSKLAEPCLSLQGWWRVEFGGQP